MDGIQGAILGVKLTYLERWTEARRAHAESYRRLLAETTARTPAERPEVRHVYHIYAVRLPQRDAWRAALTDAGVQTGIHYPIPVHLQPAYRDLGYTRGDFPVAERIAAEVLSLPMFPELTAPQLDLITGVIRAGLPEGPAEAGHYVHRT
jgi:dTDP-4-amino-4,6-dideoxygalactose transaminase